jgi:hypothetical protein
MRRSKVLAIAGVATSLMLTFGGTAFAAPITGTGGNDSLAGTPRR